ncbi:MAG: flavin reductase family protein [Alphaproteobacteria bacterium]
MSIDPREFRNTVGCFATGITVITTVDESGGPVGFTANSFTSLSLDPPLVLFCLDRKVTSFGAFAAKRPFAVNILSSAQTDVSQRFATTGPEKWEGVAFESWETGSPILPDCLANLDCTIESVHEGGDHVIVIGRVVALNRAEAAPGALLYYNGRYTELAG